MGGLLFSSELVEANAEKLSAFSYNTHEHCDFEAGPDWASSEGGEIQAIVFNVMHMVHINLV